MYYFLQEDFEELNEKIGEIKSILKQTLKQIGESAREDPGNAWHDNFAFEEANRQIAILSAELKKLTLIKNNSRVIKPGKSENCVVDIGRTVVLRDEQTNKKRRMQIRGFMLSPKRSAVSYHSSLAKIILGAKVGETRKGEIAGRKKRFKIIKIK